MGNVSLCDAIKRYDDIVAVNEMTLEIEDGEFLCLVGPSGCGKSTTLEMISGLTLPSDGTISIAGDDVTDDPPKDRDIAMVFQNIALFPHMDVYDNISFGLRLRDFERAEIDRRVEQAATIVKLDGMLERSPKELSGGQQQRVGIARAIVREPAVFLMDEPLANLDAKLRVHMRTEIQRLQKELDITTVYVTHDQEEAMTMADRIAIIDQGVIQQCAPPLECYTRPANEFVATFIGSPSMNRFDGVVRDGSIETEHLELALKPERGREYELGDEDGGRDVSVGVRPENVYLVSSDDEPASPSASFAAVVDVLEPVGDQTYAYVRPQSASAPPSTDGSLMGDATEQLLVSVDPDTSIGEDERIEVVFDREKVHVFDDASGDALTHGLVGPLPTDDAASSSEEVQGD